MFELETKEGAVAHVAHFYYIMMNIRLVRKLLYIYIYIRIFVGDANAYNDTNNNLVSFDIALRPFIPFFSKSTWEFVTRHKIP